MAEEPAQYVPTTIEKVFELLDNKLVTLGVPGALSFVGIAKARENLWTEAALCFAGAAGVWIVIKVGKKLSPKIDQLLDTTIAAVERSLLNGWSALRSDFEGQYLQQQARICEEFTIEGYNPDRTAIPLLEDVFVPLDLSGAIHSGALDQIHSSKQLVRWQRDMTLMSANLSIWKVLERSRHDRKFRKLVIQAKGGMGKTTLLRHIALIYGQRKQRRYRSPRLVPVLLRLRDWGDLLTQAQPPTLPNLIAEHHVPSLSKNHPLTAPPDWAKTILTRGLALVMFDGFDEVPEDQRTQVSHWLSAQMREYEQSVFILTSRPAGYKDYVAQKPTIPLFINKFNPQQQADFIQRWYLCQEQCCRSEKQRHHAKRVAQERSQNLIQQLQARREELGYMAENPLLLNMLVTFHRFDPTRALPQQRLGLYRGICKLQLDDRPRARGIQMLLPLEKNQTLLQIIALTMVQKNRLTVPRQGLLQFLERQALLQQEDVNPADWLKQVVEIGELLVEREPGEYEFPHASFQGFFAAAHLAQPQDQLTFQANAQQVLQNWTKAIWRETVLLYTAQLPPKLMAQVIQFACNTEHEATRSEAADLASACVKEYPRPEKLSRDLLDLLRNLTTIAQDSKYQTLEALLRAGEWKKADYETYRLMITNPTVGKEEGQWFNSADFENFPCDDLRTIDQLWVNYSNGKFGFSVQKRIWQECGSPVDYNDDWKKFGDLIGWRKGGNWLSEGDLIYNPKNSPTGELPVLGVGFVGVGVFGGWAMTGFSSLAQRLVNCSKSQS